MSLQSWLHDRERWAIAQHQIPQRYTSNGRYVFDEKGVELATCRDERIAAAIAAILGAAEKALSHPGI